MVICSGLELYSLYKILSTAEPAPRINIFFPSGLIDFLCKSSIKPEPSVDSRKNCFSFFIIVFTAFINFASLLILPLMFVAARFFNGRVTFNPFAYLSEKNSEIKPSKAPCSTLYAL